MKLVFALAALTCLIAKSGVCASNVGQDVWDEIAMEMDERRWEEWSRASPSETHDWTEWFNTQLSPSQRYENADVTTYTLLPSSPPFDQRDVRFGRSPAPLPVPSAIISTDDMTPLLLSPPPHHQQEQAQTPPRLPHPRSQSVTPFQSQRPLLGSRSISTRSTGIQDQNTEDTLQKQRPPLGRRTTSVLSGKYELDSNHEDEILPTFSDIRLLSPSIFEPTDYFSLPRHSNMEVTPRESPKVSTMSNARSPLERPLSRRGRLTRNRSTKDTRRGMTSEQRQHVCEICGDVFGRSEHIKRHLKTVHTNDRPFVCHVCEKAFSRKDNMKQHLNTHDLDDLNEEKKKENQ